MWKNIVERTGHRWHCGSCVLHAGYLRLHTRPQYVVRISFPLQQWLQERASVLRYTCCTLPVFNSLLFFCDRENCVCWRSQFGPNFWREGGFPEARIEVTNPRDHCPSLEAYSHSGNEVNSHLLWNRRVIAYSQDPTTDRCSELKDASLYLAFVSLLTHKRFSTNLMFGPRTRIPPR